MNSTRRCSASLAIATNSSSSYRSAVANAHAVLARLCAQAPLCFPCHCLGQLCIRLPKRRKRPCCVGKILRVEVVQAQLCFLCQCCKQPRICLAQRRKRPCCVGELLRRSASLAIALDSYASVCPNVANAHAVLARSCGLKWSRPSSASSANAANSRAYLPGSASQTPMLCWRAPAD